MTAFAQNSGANNFRAYAAAGFLAVAMGLGAMASGSTVSAQEPAAAEPSWTIIHAGQAILDPAQGIREQVSIVLRGDVIERVESGYIEPSAFDGSGSGPVRVIDLKDEYVLPGLIDAHVHLTIPYGGRMDRYVKTSEQRTIDGVENAYVTLMAGYTLVRDVADAYDGKASAALSEAIEAERIPGPRMLTAGAALSPTGGHSDAPNKVKYIGDNQAPGVCDGPEDCRRAVRWQVRQGADLIKIHATGGGSEETGGKGYEPSFTEAEFAAIVDGAHDLDRKVAAHAHGFQGINAALRAGVDSIEHGSFLNRDSIALFKKSGAYLVPTMAVLNHLEKRVAEGATGVDGRNVQFIEEMPENIGAAFKAGVKIAAGSDAGVVPHGDNAKELARYVSIGMTPTEALLSSTHHAAVLMDLEDKTGTIEPGKWADIIAVSENPLKDITALENVVFVMRAGTVYKDGTER